MQRDLPDRMPRDIVDAVAVEIGAGLTDYLREMFPQVVEPAPSTFLLSIRNHLRNDMAHVATLTTPEALHAWIASRQAHRKKLAKIRAAGTRAARKRERDEAASHAAQETHNAA